MKQTLISILMSHTNLNYIEAAGVVEEIMAEIEEEILDKDIKIKQLEADIKSIQGP